MGIQEPKYREVVGWITDCMEKGELRAGDKLPSENELSSMFSLSRQTIRRAIEVLERQKLVTRVRGSGTYIGNGEKAGRRERYNNIAVISTYVDSYIFPSVLKGIEAVLSEQGFTTQIAFTGNSTGREREILSALIEKDRIDGLVVEPAKSAIPNPNVFLYRELMKRRVPILCFNCNYPELGLPCVAMDDVQVGRMAAEYLIRAGHTRIGGIFKCDDGQGPLRCRGFMDGLFKAGLEARDKNIVWVDTDSAQAMELWEDYLFSRMEGVTGVVCYNDQVAYQLSELCRKRGISIPGQLSIVGIDNSELSAMAQVKITSIPHPMEALGRRAAENIIRIIENPYFDGNYFFESQVIEKDSVRIMHKDAAGGDGIKGTTECLK